MEILRTRGVHRRSGGDLLEFRKRDIGEPTRSISSKDTGRFRESTFNNRGRFGVPEVIIPMADASSLRIMDIMSTKVIAALS
jgi:hypothetical protein